MDYNSIEGILDSIGNMTVVVNNVGHDDDSVSVAGTEWLSFKGAAVSTIYCNGNSWLGFGSSSEHLRVNRRDAKMWYLYREEGTLYGYYHFLRVRWRGYSYYSNTSASYLQEYDVLLFDTGDICLHMVNIPTSNNDGTNQLVADKTYTFSYSADAPNITFYKQEDGGYTVKNELVQITPPFDRKYLIQDAESKVLYNIADEALNQLQATTVSADTFRQYGMDVIEHPELLLGISKPVVLYWQDSDLELPEKKVLVIATPPPQEILTIIDISDESIKGVDSVTADVSGDPRFACSFDGGTTWKIHSGTEWTVLEDGSAGMAVDVLTAITSEQWETAIADISSIVLRITISTTEDIIRSVVFKFTN